MTRDRAVASAAKEQEELMVPKEVAKPTLLASDPPKYGVSLPFGTKACIMALIKYPNTKAQPDFQKKPAAVFAASPNEIKNSIEIKFQCSSFIVYIIPIVLLIHINQLC
jgi:hypothetical protein